MVVLISVCNLSWWIILLSMLIPAILGWLLAKQFALDEQHSLRSKIKALELSLQKHQESKKVSSTKLVSPSVKFSDIDSTISKDRNQKAYNPTNQASKSENIKRDVVLETSSSGNEEKIQRESAKNQKSVSNKNASYPKLNDNLEIIEGIGSKMNEILSENGISTWNQLAETTPTVLKAILNKYGDRYRIIDPTTWPEQAKLARDRQWDQLITLQETKEEGKRKSPAKWSKMLIKYGYAKKYKENDLKAIEGIGPQIAKLLHSSGIKTWNQLAKLTPAQLEQILEKAGKRFSLASPESWPAQARLAADGNFSGLEQLQSKLKGGR